MADSVSFEAFDEKFSKYNGPSLKKFHKMIYDKKSLSYGCWRIFRSRDLIYMLENISNDIKYIMVGMARHNSEKGNIDSVVGYIPATDNFFFHTTYIYDPSYSLDKYEDDISNPRIGIKCEKFNQDPSGFPLYVPHINPDTYDSPDVSFDYKESMQYKYDDMIRVLQRTREFKNAMSLSIDMLNCKHGALSALFYGVTDPDECMRIGKWNFLSPNEIKMREFRYDQKFIDISIQYYDEDEARIAYIPSVDKFFVREIDDDIDTGLSLYMRESKQYTFREIINYCL